VPGFFITGTDTGVGKTWTTVVLMRLLKAQGLTVLGMKPIASGCCLQDGKWRNEDALLLQGNASFPVEYAKLNIYAFEQPISPHLAARQTGQTVDLAEIVRQYRELEQMADCVLVEGVGGWEVPLNSQERVSHLAKALNLPVILVVGVRLGCLNHALLTFQAIRESGAECVGWVANCLNAEFPHLEENIETLKTMLEISCLGIIPHSRQASKNIRKCFIDNEFSACGLEQILRRLRV
jgi:dethiobiotin synthetase